MFIVHCSTLQIYSTTIYYTHVRQNVDYFGAFLTTLYVNSTETRIL